MSYSLPLLMMDLSKAQRRLSDGRGLGSKFVISELNVQIAIDIPFILADPSYIPVIEFEKVLAMISEYDIKEFPIQDDYVLALNHLFTLYQLIQKRSPEPIESIEKGVAELKNRLLTHLGFSDVAFRLIPSVIDNDAKPYQKALSLSQERDLDERRRLSYFKALVSDVIKGRVLSWRVVKPLIEDNIEAQVQLINCYLDYIQGLFDKEDQALIFDVLEEAPKLLAVIKDCIGEGGLVKIKDRIKRLSRPSYSFGDSCYLNLTTLLSCECNDFSFIEYRKGFQSSQAFYNKLTKKADEAVSTLEIKREPSSELLALPISYSLKKFVASQGEKVEEQFLIFYRQFEKHNKKADMHHKRESYAFFSRAAYGISLIMSLLDIELLNDKMRHNNNMLERLMTHIPIIDDDIYKCLIDAYTQKRLKHNDKKTLHKSETILGFIATLYHYINLKNDESLRDNFKERIIACYRTQTLDEIEHSMVNYQFELILRDIGLTRSHIPLYNLPLFLEIDKLQLIAEGLITLAHSRYRALYIEQLKCELKGENIGRFAHDISQSNRMGQAIALHNARTKALLKGRGLNTDALSDHTKKRDYLYDVSDTALVGEAHHKLYHAWLHLDRLRGHLGILTDVDPRTQQLLKRYNQLVDELSVALNETKTRHDYINILLRESSVINIQKAYKLLKILQSKDSQLSKGLGDEIDEALQVYDEFNAIPPSNRIKRVKAKMMPYHFEVRMKNKAELDTLDLGDIMACCMAHTASSFQSMVLTRVIDAMPIVVIEDKVTNKTAGLLWLYLAEKEDHTLCLVGEYLETNTKYAKPQLMKALHHALLAFSHGIYEKLGKLDGFYLGKHFYGVTSGAVDHYPVEELSLEEVVGGLLNAAEPAYEEPLNKQRLFNQDYALLNFYAIHNTAHRFDKAIHNSESIPGLYELNDLLGSLCDRAMKKGHTTIEAIKSFIISTAGFSIAPFFEDSLLIDPAFEHVLKVILEKVIALSEESADINGDSEAVSQARTGYRTESDHRRTGRYRFFIAALPSSDLPQPNVDVRETLQLLR